MSEQILINCTPQEVRAAIIQQGVAQEFLIERSQNIGYVGNIYMGKVVRVLPGLQSAFVDIGLERSAFIHVDELIKTDNQQGIENLLQEGSQLMLQVTKDPIGTKGARLTARISLAGRMLVYLPFENNSAISQRIENTEERKRLLQLIPQQDSGGYIVRTIAEGCDEVALLNDLDYLKKRWQGICEKAKIAAPCTLLYRELSLAQRLLRDYLTEETENVLIDSRENFDLLSSFSRQYMPQVLSKLVHYQGERPLFELYDIDKEIDNALSRRVELKSGGYLIFDQTEAMTTIDVNTGAFVGFRNFDETIFKTNLEAVQSIARQVRLRNLGGIIIADFIDMANQEHRKIVYNELQKYIARDSSRMTASNFSELGLIEMTRKRARDSLAHILCESCPTCFGRGQIKTVQTMVYDILRELLREARLFTAKEYRILANARIIDYFQEEESQSLALLSDFIGKTISLQAESGYGLEDYDIVLL